MTTPTAIIIAACILVTHATLQSLFAWYVAFPYQERYQRKHKSCLPWLPVDDKAKDDKKCPFKN